MDGFGAIPDRLQQGVIRVVEGERSIGVGLRQCIFPLGQPPGLVRPKINRHLTLAVEVDLEPGTMEDDAVRNVANEVVGERVFFPQPVCLAKGEPIDKISTDMVSVMDGGADQRRKAALDAPKRLRMMRQSFRMCSKPVMRTKKIP